MDQDNRVKEPNTRAHHQARPEAERREQAQNGHKGPSVELDSYRSPPFVNPKGGYRGCNQAFLMGLIGDVDEELRMMQMS